MTGSPILDGIRILDFTWVLAGPYATRLLADFGAEVIKVQPPAVEPQDRIAQGYEANWNRNKLGVSLDLSKPEGLALARRLVAISDAVVENFSPRVMANWDLDYENLRKIRPAIIMLSMSTMGNTGPERNYTGFGPTVQAISGMTYLTSYPGRPPSGLGFAYADHVAGLYGAMALFGALEHRRKTGEGQYIDLSQVESMVNLMGPALLEHGLTGTPPGPQENRSSHSAPHGAYRCRGEDRWCAIDVRSEADWQGLCQALGNPFWTKDSRFTALSDRLDNADELDRLVEAWTLQQTAEEVMDSLQKAGVTAGTVQDADDLARDPQLIDRDFFVELDHPELGRTISDASPIRLSNSPAEYHRPAPIRGQDNEYAFGKLLGLSQEEMARLRSQGVI